LASGGDSDRWNSSKISISLSISYSISVGRVGFEPSVLDRLGGRLPAGFDLDALGGHPDDDVMIGHVALNDRAGTDDRVLADPAAGPHHRVVGHAGVVLDDRVVVSHGGLVDDVVIVAVDVDAVGDRRPVADGELAAVVEVDIVVDYRVVANGDVVAVGEGDPLEKATVVATLLKEMVGEHPAKLESELDVVGHRRGVELPPEPLKVFRSLEFLLVLFGVVFGLDGRVARVIPLEANPRGRRDRLTGLPGLVGLPVTEQVDEDVLDDLAGFFVRGQPFVDLIDESSDTHGGVRG